jgi:CHASE3 domain sensor protein
VPAKEGLLPASRRSACLSIRLLPEEVPTGDPMTDERVVRLLEELRDLQRAHVENYREALRNQEESIRLQQAGLRRVRWILLAAGLVLVLAVVALVGLLARVSETLR